MCCIIQTPQLDNEVHAAVLERIAQRDASSSADVADASVHVDKDQGAGRLSHSFVADSGLNLHELLISPTLPNSADVANASGTHGAELYSVDDPVTGRPVVPPPFVTTGKVLQDVVKAEHDGMAAEEKDIIRYSI